MFEKILHANDGSEYAFDALALALDIASQNNSELHMVCVEEISYMPDAIEEIREETGTAGRRFHPVVQRSRALAEQKHVQLKTHVIAGHPVRDIIALATDLNADLLVIGGAGHSAFYERLVGGTAARVVLLARCPVLVVK